MRSDERTEDLKAACALVVAGDRRGTGYLIRTDALLTCYHVVQSVEDGHRVQVKFLHTTIEARVRHLDVRLDCSLLLLDAPLSVKPLRLADHPPERGQSCVVFGFPAATFESGLLLDGTIQDHNALDLMQRPALAFHSDDLTPNTEARGFSGSPILKGGYVIGQLTQIIPDEDEKPQFQRIFAIPASVLARLLPHEGGERRTLLRQSPPTPYSRAAFIKRPVEEQRALSVLEFPGKAIALRAPSRAGTTWLLRYLTEQLADQGETVFIDCKLCLGQSSATKLSEFLREFMCQIVVGVAEALNITDLGAITSEYQNPKVTEVVNATQCMSQAILPRLKPSRLLSLALDGVEKLDRLPYRDQFFAMLRYWVSLGTEDESTWGRLRLLLSLSTVTSLTESNIYQSPLLTVAELINVADLDAAQVAHLAALHGVSWSPQEQSQAHALVGGNAYLVHLIIHERRTTGRPLAEIMAPEYGLFMQYLQLCKERLSKSPALRKAFFQALQFPTIRIDEQDYDRLNDAGFLERKRGSYFPRYGILMRLLQREVEDGSQA
ncbi:MAG: AAA-like domain-containing protein [Polyangia bacterium]